MGWSAGSAGLDLPLGLGDVGLAAKHSASTSSPWPFVLLVLAVLGGNWAWHAWRHPYGPCWRCRGSGRNKGSTGKRHGMCKRCKGSGRRLRTGAWLLHRGLAETRRAKK